MKSTHVVAFGTLLTIFAAGCSKPAPEAPAAPAAPAAEAAPAAQQLQVSKSVTIEAPIATVWAKVKDFNALNGWLPAVAKDEIVEGNNNEVGAVRLLTLGDGGTIKEKLLAYDEAAHSFQYSILEGVLPVSDYVSTLALTADGETKTTVTWSSTFQRKDTSATPAEGATDQVATDAVNGVYDAGLGNLKTVLETK